MAPAFRRHLKKKPKPAQKQVAEAVATLRINPKHPGLRVHRVQGAPGVYEARIDKRGRLTFHWEDGKIVLRANCEHDTVLRSP